MYDRTKSRAAAQRSAERRQREDEAARLAEEIPTLTSMRIEITEKVPNGTNKYVKLVVVARAPALFMFTCGDRECEDGGHDVTRAVIMGLRNHLEHFEGQSDCNGMTGSAPCTRALEYKVSAQYSGPRSRQF
jgi:hypothetical protein